jgi:hypothetical protein
MAFQEVPSGVAEFRLHGGLRIPCTKDIFINDAGERNAECAMAVLKHKYGHIPEVRYRNRKI